MGFRFVVRDSGVREERITREGKEMVFRKQGMRFEGDRGDSFAFEVTLFEGMEPYAVGEYELDEMSFDRQGGRLSIPRPRFTKSVRTAKA